MSSNDIDRWHEHEEAKQEAREWKEYEDEIEAAIASMTTDEYDTYNELLENLNFAEDHQEDDYQKYCAAIKAYNLGVAKWPILLREY